MKKRMSLAQKMNECLKYYKLETLTTEEALATTHWTAEEIAKYQEKGLVCCYAKALDEHKEALVAFTSIYQWNTLPKFIAEVLYYVCVPEAEIFNGKR